MYQQLYVCTIFIFYACIYGGDTDSLITRTSGDGGKLRHMINMAFSSFVFVVLGFNDESMMLKQLRATVVTLQRYAE